MTLLFWPTLHRDVLEPGLDPRHADTLEAVAFVESARLRLRIERDAVISHRSGERDEPLEHGAADAPPTPFAPHGNAADVAVRQKPRTADRALRRILGDRMPAGWVAAIALELDGDAQLDDEHVVTDFSDCRLVAPPLREPDGERVHA